MTEDQVRVIAALVGIEITLGQMPGVIANLASVLDQAALLFDPPLSFGVEPAPLFVP